MVKTLLILLLCLAAPAWAQHDHRPAKPALGMSVHFDTQGRLWRAEAREGRVWVSHSDDRGRSFSAPVAVNAVPEKVAADGENRPKIVVGPARQVYVSWTQSLDKPYTGHVRFARSLDGGRSFSEPIIVNDNRDLISHRFESLLLDGSGRIHLAWLDKRDAVAAQAGGKKYAGAALYHAVSDDGGRSFGVNRRLAANSCECCRVMTVRDVDGVPLVFWRHIFGSNERDHALLKLDGTSELVRVSHDLWKVDACPHHGPGLAVAPDGARHLAWFNNGPARHGLFYARMEADGRQAPPMPFGNYAAQAAHPSVAAVGAAVALAWKEFDGTRASAWVMSSADGGRSWQAPRRLAETAGPSDQPLLVTEGASVYLSWNTAQEGYRLLPLGAKP
ncbi:MAG: sialidase family protein [Thiobacillus sp.]|nr:sialidase family protein [Thiobacillus sp.]